jgi:hypothetical protein
MVFHCALGMGKGISDNVDMLYINAMVSCSFILYNLSACGATMTANFWFPNTTHSCPSIILVLVVCYLLPPLLLHAGLSLDIHLSFWLGYTVHYFLQFLCHALYLPNHHRHFMFYIWLLFYTHYFSYSSISDFIHARYSSS